MLNGPIQLCGICKGASTFIAIAIAPKIADHAGNFSRASQTALTAEAIDSAHPMIASSGADSRGPNFAARANTRAPIEPMMMSRTFTPTSVHTALLSLR